MHVVVLCWFCFGYFLTKSGNFANIKNICRLNHHFFYLLWQRSKTKCQTTSRIWKFHGNIRKNSWNYNKSMKILSNYNGNMKNLSNFDRKNVRNLVLLMFKKQGQKHMWCCCVKIQHIEFCRYTSSTDRALVKNDLSLNHENLGCRNKDSWDHADGQITKQK